MGPSEGVISWPNFTSPVGGASYRGMGLQPNLYVDYRTEIVRRADQRLVMSTLSATGAFPLTDTVTRRSPNCG